MDDRLTLDRIIRFLKLNYAVVGQYEFTGLRLKDKHTRIPYLSLARTESVDFRCDNGRLLYAGFCRIVLTEVDLEIVLQQYEFDLIDIKCAMVSQKGYLPEEYKNVIRGYYHNKTVLKGDDTEDGKYIYMKSKNMLNSIY